MNQASSSSRAAQQRRQLFADTDSELSDMDTGATAAGGYAGMGRSQRITYFLFLGMGLATLLPWNLFISASEFYHYQFAGSAHQATYQNSFSVAYMVTNFVSTLYAMATVTRADPNKRILGGLIANTVAYVVGMAMPVMREYRGDVSFYIVTLQLIATAVSSGMLTNSLFALVAHFTSSHVEGVFSGQAVAGLIATVAQLVTAYTVSPPTVAIGAGEADEGLISRTIAYFVFATVVNLTLTLGFLYVRRDPYYQQQSRLAYPLGSQSGGAVDEAELLISSAAMTSPLFSGIDAFRTTFKQISGYTYVIVLDFAITLSVYPSVTALVTSTSGFKLLTEWHFFIYNIGDFLGRRVAPSIPVSRVSSLMSIALARVLLIPAFFVCHLGFSAWYNWIDSDYVFLALVVMLGLTNGYLSTRAAIIAPGLSSHPTIAGSIVAISIGTGLAMGSVLSWPIRAAGCLCSPFGGH
ncbi:hypothetical protein LPJ53_004008 [Coemansia erecta]|uniref:Nucleoside transporter n=1 Tax=Coemansia erecta TaxID=147472 RepID=A0A9W7XZH0_9FUNG|nr:hypothetical protein LPJ53_004008 [Coemansia erecta]